MWRLPGSRSVSFASLGVVWLSCAGSPGSRVIRGFPVDPEFERSDTFGDVTQVVAGAGVQIRLLRLSPSRGACVCARLWGWFRVIPWVDLVNRLARGSVPRLVHAELRAGEFTRSDWCWEDGPSSGPRDD